MLLNFVHGAGGEWAGWTSGGWAGAVFGLKALQTIPLISPSPHLDTSKSLCHLSPTHKHQLIHYSPRASQALRAVCFYNRLTSPPPPLQVCSGRWDDKVQCRNIPGPNSLSRGACVHSCRIARQCAGNKEQWTSSDHRSRLSLGHVLPCRWSLAFCLWHKTATKRVVCYFYWWHC